MIGYKVFWWRTPCGLSDEEHVAALINVATAFGDVRRTDEVVAMFEKS